MIIISRSYNIDDFKDFIDDIKDKSCSQIKKKKKKELHEVRASEQDNTEYAEMLRGFLFFIQWGKKPNAISKKEFQLFQPVFDKFLQSEEPFNSNCMK